MQKGRGIAIRREQFFFVLGRCLGYGGGSLPVLHRIKEKSGMLITCGPYPWVRLGCPNMELYLRSVEFTFYLIPMTTVDV